MVISLRPRVSSTGGNTVLGSSLMICCPEPSSARLARLAGRVAGAVLSTRSTVCLLGSRTSRPRLAMIESTASGLVVSATARPSSRPPAASSAGRGPSSGNSSKKTCGRTSLSTCLRDDVEQRSGGRSGWRPECRDHHVQSGRRRHGGEDQDRPEQPVGADAAGQERHRFAVAGHPAEPDQEPDQERHRDGQPEGLRDSSSMIRRPSATARPWPQPRAAHDGGSSRMNVKISSDSRNGGRISRMT